MTTPITDGEIREVWARGATTARLGALILDTTPSYGGRFSLVPQLAGATSGGRLGDGDIGKAARLAERDAFRGGLIAAINVAVDGFDSVGNGSGADFACQTALDWVENLRAGTVRA